jgi:hypothetical protein
MSSSTLLFRIVVVAFLVWTVYKWGGGVYHFLHRRSLRQTGDTVVGTVTSLRTIPRLSRSSNLVKVKCRVRYQANDGQFHETAFRHTYLQGSVPRLGDVTDVYINPSNPADAEADRYPKPPYASSARQ